MNVEEVRRVERVAGIAAIAAAALAPLAAVPIAFAAVERAASALGAGAPLPSASWRLAIAGLSAVWSAVWTARHAPEMVRAGLRRRAAAEAGR